MTTTSSPFTDGCGFRILKFGEADRRLPGLLEEGRWEGVGTFLNKVEGIKGRSGIPTARGIHIQVKHKSLEFYPAQIIFN
jgi:hypothetical protein